MLASLILGISVVAAAPEAAPSAKDLKAYDAAKAKVGRDADSHVNLALWCEAHGLPAERLKHLALAVLIEPKNAKARALMGLIAFGGRWERPDAVGRKIQDDTELAKKLAEYNTRRAKTPYTADAQWKLALWCEEHGLKLEAIAHLTTVVRLEPKREAAWKRLGYKQIKGRWVTEAQLADFRAELEIQKQADLRWRKQLGILSARLSHHSSNVEAVKELAEITDPRAVPAIWSTFVTGRTPKPTLAVQLLGQIDSSVASKALVFLALSSSSSSDIRRAAAETLNRRDPREFASLLIAMIREPIKYDAHGVEGPGKSGTLHVQGKKFDVQRQYTAPSLPNIQAGPNDFLTYDANGLPVLNEIVGPVGRGPVYIDSPQKSIVDLYIINKLNMLMSNANTFGSDVNWQVEQALSNSSPTVFDLGRNDMANAPLPLGITFNSDQDMASLIMFGDVGIQSRTFTGLTSEVNYIPLTANVAHIPIGRMAVEAQKSAIRAQRQLQNDVSTIEQANAQAAKISAPVLEVLKGATGQDFGPDRKAWSKWLADAQGYAFISNENENRPTVFEEVGPVMQSVPVTVTNQVVGFEANVELGFRAVSCFGAGTEVYTMAGRRPIESLKAGDRVLTWNTATGSLGMQPILTVYHNPPSRTLRIEFEGESIVTTPWHRFWMTGKGWVAARDLKPGDLVRTLEQPAKVIAVSPMEIQPVFNLEVAQDHNFLVGRQGALVHDNSVAATVSTPFDGTPSAPLTPQGR